MLSEEQLAANRRNAKASTGPRTDEGKSASSINAMKHGLTSTQWVLPTDDKEQFKRLRERMLAELAPKGALEEELADEIVKITWRLRRVENVELGIFACGVSTADEEFLTRRRNEFCEITQAGVTKASLAERGSLTQTTSTRSSMRLCTTV